MAHSLLKAKAKWYLFCSEFCVESKAVKEKYKFVGGVRCQSILWDKGNFSFSQVTFWHRFGNDFIWSIFYSLSVMAGNDWKIKEVSFLLIFVSAAGLITFDVCGSWNILSFSLHFRSPAWKGLSKFRAPGHFYKSSPKYFWQLRNNKISRTLLTYNLYSINHPQAWWPSLVLLSSFSFPWFFTFKGDLQKYKHCFCGGCC